MTDNLFGTFGFAVLHALDLRNIKLKKIGLANNYGKQFIRIVWVGALTIQPHLTKLVSLQALPFFCRCLSFFVVVGWMLDADIKLTRLHLKHQWRRGRRGG